MEPARTVSTDDRDSRETRERLREMLEQYPPSLGEVLRLDPSLLRNENYLATYPRLAGFLAQHPEIAHNPAYFVGEIHAGRWDAPNPRREALEMWQNVMAGVALFSCSRR